MRRPASPPFGEVAVGAWSTPAWLAADGFDADCVVSSRARAMRNLRGFRFPSAAKPSELLEVARLVREAACRDTGSPETTFRALGSLQLPDFDALVRLRLVSPHFAWREPGRLVLVNDAQTASILVNEEDHLRIQVLLPGHAVEDALEALERILAALSRSLEFAQAEPWGFLASSPPNCGSGLRLSVMAHLIGLAHAKRLRSVLAALTQRGLVVRGLFGEASKATGAFVQISTTQARHPGWRGARDFLLGQERAARSEVPRESLLAHLREIAAFLQRCRTLQPSDALRALAWLRWGLAAGALTGASIHEADRAWCELQGDPARADLGPVRARALRAFLQDLTLSEP
ncbi:MAG: hypothetical protein N2109_00320 [Fimbriimonadales bacterium]|nr:hypothetical protein [Fimbriimonadales bacterium]